MDWETLTYGASRDSIADVIKDEDWQILRKSLKGQSLELKHATLTHWIEVSTNAVQLERRKIQVGNYVNALRRAGLVPRRGHED